MPFPPVREWHIEGYKEQTTILQKCRHPQKMLLLSHR